MRSSHVLVFSLMLMSFSCQKKQVSLYKTEINPLKIDLAATSIKNQPDNIDITKLQRLNLEEYKNLQLDKVKGLEGYTYSDLSMGRIILSNEGGKILTIQLITDGEVSEFLLSYDKDGNLVDNLIVAYEDMVEYYSEISSKLNSDEILVQTVNFTYEDSEGNETELSDTTITKYTITPDFRFITN